MSANTPLLPGGARRKDDHPIFSRICHSPWAGIGQKVLVFLRGAVLAYTFIAFFLVLDYELQYLHRYKSPNHPNGPPHILENPHSPGAPDSPDKINSADSRWLIPFEFPNIVLLAQLIYTWIAFTWTYSHLYYPDYRSDDDDSFSAKIRRFLSPPKRNNTTKNQTLFSIFYHAANSYPLAVSFIYWAILGPQGKTTLPEGEVFDYGWYTTFYITHKYIVSAVIGVFEIFVLSSIERQDPVWAHVNAMIVFSGLYVAWAYFGWWLTERLSYYFLDYQQLGWEYVITSIVLFIAIGVAAFAFTYALIGIRTSLVKKAKDQSRH